MKNEDRIAAMLGYRSVDEMDKHGDEMKKLYDSGIIEWHNDSCRGRHGVVRNVSKADFSKVASMLVYFFGSKCYWNTKQNKGKTDFEFVHMTKVSPPPKKPWEWCGTSVLFEDWHIETEDRYDLTASFRLGEKVEFTIKGQTHTGTVYSNTAQRVGVVTDGGRWRIPPAELRRT